MKQISKFGAAVFLAALIVGVSTGCSDDSTTTVPSIDVVDSRGVSSEPAITRFPPSTTTKVTGAPTTTTTPVQKLSPAGTACGEVTSKTAQTARPVAVLQGQVDCLEAMDVATTYVDGIDAGKAAGQRLSLTVKGWRCSWPYVDGRSHDQSYLKCATGDGVNAIRIGA